MGGFISGKEKNVDQTLIDVLRKIKLEEVSKLKAFYDSKYPETFKLDFLLYEDIFSEINIKWEALGKRLMDADQTIDVFEVFAVLFTFCDGLFELKLKELFILFDFDGSGEIDFSEMYLALQSTLLGFCKLLGFPAPSSIDVKALSTKAMKMIDANENDNIDFNEFSEWIANDEEIQDFFVEYLSYQTREHALKQFQALYHKYIDCFNVASGFQIKAEEESKEPKCDISKLREQLMLRKEAIIPETEIDEILLLLDTKKVGKVDYKTYVDAIRAMCSYLATDLNGDHILQQNEVSTLLWLTEGVEPTKARVNQELKSMDINSDGTISMIEWISYLASIDPVSGTPYFDFDLKQKFDMYDTDDSGSISKHELLQMLEDTFAELMKELKETIQAILKNELDAIAKKIIKQLDKDGSEVLEWNEFKQYMHTFTKEKQQILDIIRKAKEVPKIT